MPDISALNGTAVNNVGEFDGLTVSPGINPDAATSGFLFTYSGAAVAYSVRQLNNNAPYVMRVRRVTGTGNDGNDDEADVRFDTTLTDPTISLDSPVDNFSAGGSNATTLGEFLNVGTVNSITYTDADSLSPNTAEAYVDAWYDLTGNQNHAEQSTPASQPQIHSGLANTDLITENGKPTLDTSGGQSFSISVSTLAANTYSVFHVSRINDSDNLWVMLADSLGNQQLPRAQNNTVTNVAPGWTVSNWYKDGSSVTISTRNDVLTTYGNTQFLANYYGSPNADATQAVLFDRVTGSTYDAEGKHQEYILWPSDQDSAGNRTGIETDINGYFSIY